MQHEVRLVNHPENELLVQGNRSCKIRVCLKIKPSASCFSAPDKDDADEQNAYARFTVPSRLTVLSFHSNIAQQNCIFHDDFLSNAEPSRASP